MKLCFVTVLQKYGAERQTYEIAKHLKRRHEVSVVGFNRRGDRVNMEEWAELNPIVVEYEMGYVKYLIVAPSALMLTLRKLDPDVCVQRSVGDLTGFVGTYCKLSNSRFIYHSASIWDTELHTALRLSPSPFSLLLYSLGLASADVIIAQTQEIAGKFKQGRFRRKKVIVVPQLYDASAINPPLRKSNFVFWLGRLVWYKRPQIFVELARSLPNYQFIMAGSGPLQMQIERQGKDVRNLKLLGRVDHHRAEELCGKASIFVNTSEFEGFPNTLLECGARETPFVSLNYDPDEVICSYRIGMHSRTLQGLANDVSLLMNDFSIRQELGKNARKYVLDNHSPEKVVDAYDRMLNQLPVKHAPQQPS